MKKVAILQSNYIPWKGYFDIIHDVDEFIFHDDLQYTKNDWRNRNKIKTAQGTNWVTIPVGTAEHRLICEVVIKDQAWQKKHWQLIANNYAKAPYFPDYKPCFEEVYLGREWPSLSELNQHLIRVIASEILGIQVVFRDSREYHLQEKKQERVLELLVKTGAGLYVSGPAAKDYIQEERFREAGIELVWKDYSGYPEYSQFHPPFEHGVTVLDLLFHAGPDAPYYIWGWREAGRVSTVI
ncbi:MAG: WbqC family protein [Pseudomonadota bacterium]